LISFLAWQGGFFYATIIETVAYVTTPADSAYNVRDVVSTEKKSSGASPLPIKKRTGNKENYPSPDEPG